MGPFSNNTPPRPSAPNTGSKLPIPDIDGMPQDIVVSTEPDHSLATRKWFLVTMISAGIMAAVGLVVFIAYVIVSNTPGYMLNAAMQNLVTGDGEAGTVQYETKQSKTANVLAADFIAYTDPTNRANSTLTFSVGQSDARVSGTARIFTDGSYFQTAGLGNIGRLIASMQGGSSHITTDQSFRLSGLDGQWYTFTGDDVYDLRNMLPRQIRGGFTSQDIETLRQLYLKHAFLTSVQQLGDEQIEGINTMHLRVGFDQAKLTEFLNSVRAANIKSMQINDDDIRAIQSGKFLGLDKATIETWIARSDRSFQQIRIAHPDASLTVTFHSEQVAAQRQTVVRPEAAKTATTLVRGIQGILSTPTAAR